MKQKIDYILLKETDDCRYWKELLITPTKVPNALQNAPRNRKRGRPFKMYRDVPTIPEQAGMTN